MAYTREDLDRACEQRQRDVRFTQPPYGTCAITNRLNAIEARVKAVDEALGDLETEVENTGPNSDLENRLTEIERSLD